MVLGGLGLWWWTHPGLITGSGVGFRPAPYALADFPEYVGMADADLRDHETVRLDRVTLNLSDNTAGVTVSVAVCTRKRLRSGTTDVGVQLAGEQPAGSRPDALCTRIRRVRPGTSFDYGADEYLFATIRAARGGTFRVDSVDIRYRRDWRHLWQRGTQRLAADFQQTVR